ncbi:hypothetical protein QFC20_003956 [Naganishia adeliensis]|uniref:Uncharacterized protein n=2 Tax=Naganishia adeliensis TaxID=92952 RepID=A0ACC2VMS7_9TREE|nr:hypothetical protein QFC20_005489 [Naganishia adeliensis]KAJ9106947.1 hypothetical protein QFC20_003956 [Naganishia adeliensis]
MASLPPKPNASEIPAGQAAKAGASLNRFAKRDPALYPLLIVVGGIFCTAGYMLSSKATNTEPAKAFMKGKVINPWEDDSKLDVHPSQVAAFKYRYKSREGNMEDSPPIMSQSLRTLAGPASGKFRCD